jgi:hypothetical protein
VAAALEHHRSRVSARRETVSGGAAVT